MTAADEAAMWVRWLYALPETAKHEQTLAENAANYAFAAARNLAP